MDQPGKVANPARGQLNRENNIPLSPCVPENLVSRDGFSRPVPRQPAHLHTQAESGAYLRDSSRVPRRRPFMKPPYAIGSVPSLSGHAIAYRWRSLPRVLRHRASKPQGSSERVLPWQITMNQLIFASLSHTHYWYEVGMLKVPACIGRDDIHVQLTSIRLVWWIVKFMLALINGQLVVGSFHLENVLLRLHFGSPQISLYSQFYHLSTKRLLFQQPDSPAGSSIAVVTSTRRYKQSSRRSCST